MNFTEYGDDYDSGPKEDIPLRILKKKQSEIEEALQKSQVY